MKLEDYSVVINKCSQCNFCQAVCPIYKAKESENWLARHRLNLINEVYLNKTMEDSERFKDIMDTYMPNWRDTKKLLNGRK